MSQSTTTNESSFIRNLLLGGIASSISQTIISPYDNYFHRIKKIEYLAVLPKEEKFKSFKYFKLTMERAGWSSLFKNNFSNILKLLPQRSMQLAFNEFNKSKLINSNNNNKNNNNSNLINGSLLSGGLAGLASYIISLPITNQYYMYEKKGPLTIQKEGGVNLNNISSFYKSEGLIGFYKNIHYKFPTVFVYNSIAFGGYNIGKSLLLSNENNNGTFTICKSLAIGYVSTKLAVILSAPMNTIANKLLHPYLFRDINNNVVHYDSAFDCLKNSIKSNGIRSLFFNGIRANSFGMACIFVLFDQLIKK